MAIDRSAWSSGELWTPEEEERLRLAYLAMVGQMEGRSESAVFARVERLRVRGYRNRWPYNDDKGRD